MRGRRRRPEVRLAAAVSRGRRVVAARLAWPLPALVAWAGAWCAHLAMRATGLEITLAALTACSLGLACMRLERAPWRRLAIAAGFPLSLALSGVAGALPPWAWLTPLALLLLACPIGAWRDAPIFPTPPAALD